MQPYDFRVIHIPRMHNIADTLPCLLGPSAKGATHAHNSEEYVRFIAVCATPSALTTKQFEQISENYVELQRMKTAIQTGFFEDYPACIHISGELCVIGQIIVFLQSLRERALRCVHTTRIARMIYMLSQCKTRNTILRHYSRE